MAYQSNLQIHFYHSWDEASVVLQPVIPSYPDPFCELLLFSCLTLRQFLNLKWNPLSRVLLSLIREMEYKTDEEATNERVEGEPKLVSFKGIPGPRQITARLDVGEQTGRFLLSKKGYGLLWDWNMNTDYCFSPILLMKELAGRHRDNQVYCITLFAVAKDCASAFSDGQLTSANHLTGAYHIVRENFSRFGESPSR